MQSETELRRTSSKFEAGLVNPAQVVTEEITLKPNQEPGFDMSRSQV